MTLIILDASCPNCGGAIEDDRLLKGAVCGKCLPKIPNEVNPLTLAEVLRRRNRLMRYKVVKELDEEVKRFKEEFRKAVGNEPWALQEVWACRVFLDENFSIVAPTGVGKTIFCILACLYLIKHKKRRCYLMLPSSILVDQVVDKAREFMKKLKISEDNLAYYHSALPSKTRKAMLSKITNGEFKLLVTTDRFLITRGDTLGRIQIDNIFVDDVDSFLKSPKNIDRVVKVLGFPPEVVDKVLKLIDLRLKLSRRYDKSLEQEYNNLAHEVEEAKRRKHGKLVVAGATLRTKMTKRMLIFSELLDFEPGTSPKFVRNIIDFKLEKRGELVSTAVELVKKHGRGALVFIPMAYGRELARRVTEKLAEAGIRAYFYEKMEEGILERFEKGEYDALVGIAASRSPFVRGIDLPEMIRYAVFVGVPRREVKIERYELNPNKLFTLLSNILDILDEQRKTRAMLILQNLRKVIPATADTVEKIKTTLAEGQQSGYAGYVAKVVKDAADFVKETLTPELISKIEESADISVKAVDDGFRVTIPDTSGYLQASGRTSRLYAGGVTKGVSILLVDDVKALTGLTRRLKFILEEFEWVDYDDQEALREFREVDRDREAIKEIKRGKLTLPSSAIAREALMIVESPTKARTFAKFFGKPFRRKIGDITIYSTATGNIILNIAATMGHLTDLSTTPGYYGVIIEDESFKPVFSPIKKCGRCGYQFVDGDTCPSCGSRSIFSKGEVIEALRKAALTVNEIYVATDPDAEGEKIAYDITCLLKPYNKTVYRLEFHEVTRKALLKALANKRSISTNLVEAQLVRRIEDRWFGFELSRRLWEHFGSRNLSAGRVQTPVLGWIVKRLEEAKKKKTIARVVVEGNVELSFENPQNLELIKEKAERNELAVEIKDAREYVQSISPAPPYITATLLRDAYQFLRFPVGLTMRLAQELFESGFITYHRTDSTTVSSAGLAIAREYIENKNLGEFTPRTYAREGAHECIRPVRPLDRTKLQQYIQIGLIKPVVPLTDRHLRLYDLIFRRFIASQLPPAKVVSQSFKAEMEGNEINVERVVNILETGFNKIFQTVRQENRIEPGVRRVLSMQVLTTPAARLYTEGDIISLMRERRIGRPSTYSKIVQVLFDRRYVIEKSGRLIPTSKGIKVYGYLFSNFGKYVSEETTRELEMVMDLIEEGRENYVDVLKKLKGQTEAISVRA
ncbi:MAG TPA: reverse gyrase [Aigarchaeota archaeon]|nr:reverse gyrase [Aigarchaeota archaeon]